MDTNKSDYSELEINNYYCFTTNRVGRWYKIPVNKRNLFDNYVDAMENDDKQYDGENFEKYRCMHPCNYMFKNIEVLKEIP